MSVRRVFGGLMLATAAAALAVAALAWQWLDRPLQVRDAPAVVEVLAGQSPRQVAAACVAAGVEVPAWALYAWFRLSGDDRRIRAGNYELPAGTTPRQLLRKLVDGDETLARVRLVDGWTLRQWRQALARAEGLRPDSSGLSEEALMQAIGASGLPAEGRFFPDTYSYTRGSSDLAVLRRARAAMDRHLSAVWENRAPDLPLEQPQQLLVLASIVEKETGRAEDRGLIAGVFVNRLRLGMPLQTDPTVIYGLGERFDGNLRRIDLQTDGPFNTYTRRGLPPTPIAAPGLAALQAAARPATTKALYFVARGDGSSEFSDTLARHNQAVRRYQQRQSGATP